MASAVHEAALLRKRTCAPRLPKCMWSRVQRQEQDVECLRPQRRDADLGETQKVPKGECARILGAYVQFDGQHTAKFQATIPGGWAALHATNALWRHGGQHKQQVKALHLSVFPVVAWAAGTRQWTSDTLTTLHNMQTRLPCRICHMWPYPHEEWPRRGRWREELWRSAGVPRWSEAIAAMWWRWSGHAARYATAPTQRIVNAGIRRRDVWWRWTVKAVHSPRNIPGRQRLGRGHSALGKRRWDDPTAYIARRGAQSALAGYCPRHAGLERPRGRIHLPRDPNGARHAHARRPLVDGRG